jgi:Protein of unknown function (DUF2794)
MTSQFGKGGTVLRQNRGICGFFIAQNDFAFWLDAGAEYGFYDRTLTCVEPRVSEGQDSLPITTVVALSRPVSSPLPSASPVSVVPSQVKFDRTELNVLLSLYGRKVADGEWRDYAMDFLKDRAVFSVFRRSTEYPLYRIEKNPKLARRQGAYSVVSAAGQILKRGHDLARVIAVLEKPVRLVAQ